MKHLFDIEGKVAIITGGSRGIGEMIAQGYVENGAKVYITARKATACDATAARLSEIGTCISVPQDLSTVEGVTAFAAEMAKREEKIDILVNNAGAAWGEPLEEYSEKGWDKVFDINIKSPFFLIQKMLPLLRNAATYEAPARIINTASINGINPPMLETYAYSSSKAGMIMLTRHLAQRLASDDILVNCIAPGPFQSQMMAATLAEMGDVIAEANPRKRIGQPEDIAGVAIFLASRASAYTTGACIPCDGGTSQVGGGM
ncbi:MAG: 3-oxoacyl-ACP reductase [Rhodobiaceae bacterium]|nr:MAG: 3-oxoacyl-ACP reductase [Rhodobiaceae bacterium]